MTEIERKAREAERLLNEPLLQEAFTAIEAKIVQELRTCDVSARDKQRDLVITLQLLGHLQRHLRTHIETGTLDRVAKESFGDRVRRFAA